MPEQQTFYAAYEFYSAVLGGIAGGIVLFSTFPAFLDAFEAKHRLSMLDRWPWFASRLRNGAGERNSRLIMAIGNFVLAVAITLDGPIPLAICAAAVAFMNFAIWFLKGQRDTSW